MALDTGFCSAWRVVTLWLSPQESGGNAILGAGLASVRSAG